MALYFFTYELRKKRDYQKLYDKLTKFDAIQVFESTWCFKRINTSAKGLRDYFRQYIDSNDSLLVEESVDWATILENGIPNDLK